MATREIKYRPDIKTALQYAGFRVGYVVDGGSRKYGFSPFYTVVILHGHEASFETFAEVRRVVTQFQKDEDCIAVIYEKAPAEKNHLSQATLFDRSDSGSR